MKHWYLMALPMIGLVTLAALFGIFDDGIFESNKNKLRDSSDRSLSSGGAAAITSTLKSSSSSSLSSCPPCPQCDELSNVITRMEQQVEAAQPCSSSSSSPIVDGGVDFANLKKTFIQHVKNQQVNDALLGQADCVELLPFFFRFYNREQSQLLIDVGANGMYISENPLPFPHSLTP